MNTSARAALLFLALLLSGCATLGQREPVEVSLAGLEVLEMNLLEQRYLLRLRIMNPDDRAIAIRGMSYQLWLNDSKFARGVSDQAVEVPGFGERVVEVSIVSGLTSVLRQVREFGQGQPERFTYRLAGHLSLDGAAWRTPSWRQRISLPLSLSFSGSR